MTAMRGFKVKSSGKVGLPGEHQRIAPVHGDSQIVPRIASTRGQRGFRLIHVRPLSFAKSGIAGFPFSGTLSMVRPELGGSRAWGMETPHTAAGVGRNDTSSAIAIWSVSSGAVVNLPFQKHKSLI